MGDSRIAITMAALLCGCSRDLALPGARTIPVITAISPAEVFSNDDLTISGSGFDPTPESNEVFFENARARGYAFDASGRLVVAVPEQIGSGPVTVSTPQGRSEPFGNLITKGIGHPRLGTSVGDVHILHAPPAIAAVNGDLFVPSTYFQMLLSRSGLSVALPSAPLGFSAAPDGSVLYTAFGAQGLWALDPRTGAPLAKVALGTFATRLLAAGPGVVYALGADVDGALHAAAFRGPTLTEGVERVLSGSRALGAVALPDARHLLVASDAGLLAIDLVDASAAEVAIAAPGGRNASGALAVRSDSEVEVAFDDGTIGRLALPGYTWSGAPLSTISTRPARALAVAQGLLLATKDQEGMAVALDLTLGQVAWTVQLRGNPGVIAMDPGTSHAFVADQASNSLDELDLTSPTHWLGRFSFDLGLDTPSGCDCAPSPMYPADIQDYNHHIYFLARKLRRLVSLDSYSLALNAPIPLADGASAPLGLAHTAGGTVWVLHQNDLGRIDGASETLVMRNLPVAPSTLAFAGDGRVLVGTQQEVSVYKDGARQGGLSFAPNRLAHLAVEADGGVVVAWSTAAGLQGGKWSVGDLAAGKAPLQPFAADPGLHGFFGMLEMLAGPMLFYSSCKGGGPCSVQLDPQLNARPLLTVLDEPGPIIPTPDGRYFLWSRREQNDGRLRLVSSWPGYDQTDFTTWPISAGFSRPTFDPSGEWLYVPVPGTDEIQVFQ